MQGRNKVKASRRPSPKIIKTTTVIKTDEEKPMVPTLKTDKITITAKRTSVGIIGPITEGRATSLVRCGTGWRVEGWDLAKDTDPILKAKAAAAVLGLNKKKEKKDEQASCSRTGYCVICGDISTLSCAACSKVYYCGKSHQKKHWSRHKADCYPAEPMTPKEYQELFGPLGKGPYLKATKDLKPMDKIFEDHPLSSGPGCCGDIGYEPVCLGCTSVIKETQRCSKCQWPLCGPQCEKDNLHAKYECEILAKNGVIELKDEFQYDLVRVLRCLLSKTKAPEVFQKLMQLDAAKEYRKRLDYLYEATKTACIFIRENCKLEEFDEKTIDHMCGVVDLQTMVSGRDRSSMQIFQFPSKLLHACASNTRFLEVIKPNGENLLQVVAVRPIKKGEPLTQRLVICLEPTYERQRYLMEHYYFQCKCNLCSDPTEGGTFFSATKCPLCHEKVANLPEYDCEMDKNLGYIIPTLPTEIDSPWACNNCNNEVRSLAMIHALDDVDTRVWRFKDQVLQGLKGEDQKIIALRNEIAELEAKLHPNNFHVWKLKQLLFNLLTECILLMMPPGSWKEFRDIYREIDALANFIMRTVMIQQPGYSLIRGRSLHDLVAAYWGYIQWAVVYGKASSFKTHHSAGDFFKFAEETIKIFQPEITEIRKVIDSVEFMRTHLGELERRLECWGQNVKKEKEPEPKPISEPPKKDDKEKDKDSKKKSKNKGKSKKSL